MLPGSSPLDTSFHNINLDTLLDSQGPEWTELTGLIQKGIQSGVVKPLRRAIYGMDKLAEVFRALEQGRDSAKLLVKVTNNITTLYLLLEIRSKTKSNKL